MYFTPRGKNPDDTFRVDYWVKESFTNGCHSELHLRCFKGTCGENVHYEFGKIDDDILGNWCQAEGYMSFDVTTDKPFVLRATNCCWVNNSANANWWQLLTYVDLGTRSDTRSSNRSPTTTILPEIRAPQNCPTTYNLLAHDPDGDHVRCRYGLKSNSECVACSQHPGFYLDQGTCTLLFSESLWLVYVFEIVLEDFPREDINLTYTDGTSSNRTPQQSSPLSKIPLQFVFKELMCGECSGALWLPSHHPGGAAHWWWWRRVPIACKSALSGVSRKALYKFNPPVPSCEFGEFRPQFLLPTPPRGAFREATVGREFQLAVAAQANLSVVYDIKVSGPLNITKTFHYNGTSKIGQIIAKWTPQDNDVGLHVPMCFIAETRDGYQSDLRCIVVLVGTAATQTRQAEVVCSESTMSVFVDKSSIHEVDENNLRLNDPSCKVTSNKSHFIASVSLNSCGTELEEMENSLVFKNEITSFDAPHNVITRGNVLEIPFSCSFPKTFLTSGSFTVHKTVDTFTSSGSGRFTYVFEFYNSSAFTELIKPSTYPVKAEQGEMLYVSIQVRSSLNTTQLFVESCRATPHDDPDDPIYYDIIKNGCKIDETLVVYPSNQTVYRFGMKAFNFIGEYNQVYINCVVILCLAGNPNTRCAQGCINSTSSSLQLGLSHLNRRSLGIQTERHYISQGPVQINRNLTDNSDLAVNVNVNTVVVAGAVLGTTAMVCGAVIYKTRRAIRYDLLQ
ncbi:uncharacterized protein [Lepisosteus oculatus]